MKVSVSVEEFLGVHENIGVLEWDGISFAYLKNRIMTLFYIWINKTKPKRIITCEMIFIYPDKDGIEYVHWGGDFYQAKTGSYIPMYRYEDNKVTLMKSMI